MSRKYVQFWAKDSWYVHELIVQKFWISHWNFVITCMHIGWNLLSYAIIVVPWELMNVWMKDCTTIMIKCMPYLRPFLEKKINHFFKTFKPTTLLKIRYFNTIPKTHNIICTKMKTQCKILFLILIFYWDKFGNFILILML